MTVRPVLALIALGWLTVAGCGPAKLNENKTYTLEAGDAQRLDLQAITKAQKITIEFKSSASKVNVYLIKDFKEQDGLDTAPSKAQTLEHQEGKEGNFSVEVPEKTATRIVIRGANAKTEVTLKVTNAK